MAPIVYTTLVTDVGLVTDVVQHDGAIYSQGSQVNKSRIVIVSIAMSYILNIAIVTMNFITTTTTTATTTATATATATTTIY